MEIHAVVFDLDGLLVDSEPLQAWAWREYLRTQGREFPDELLQRMLGLRGVDAVKLVVETLALMKSPELTLAERDELFLAAVPGAIRAMPGARELIDTLRDRGVPTALATSGHRRYVDLALESAGLASCFDAEVTAELVSVGKPHPDVYLRAANELNVAPDRCLALEDAPNGVRSAKRAGMVCFAVAAPGHDASLSEADAVLTSLHEVLGEVDRGGYAISVSRRLDGTN